MMSTARYVASRVAQALGRVPHQAAIRRLGTNGASPAAEPTAQQVPAAGPFWVAAVTKGDLLKFGGTMAAGMIVSVAGLAYYAGRLEGQLLEKVQGSTNTLTAEVRGATQALGVEMREKVQGSTNTLTAELRGVTQTLGAEVRTKVDEMKNTTVQTAIAAAARTNVEMSHQVVGGVLGGLASTFNTERLTGKTETDPNASTATQPDGSSPASPPASGPQPGGH